MENHHKYLPTDRIGSFALSWVLLSAILFVFLLWLNIEQQRKQFATDSQLLYEQLQKRLDQNEAILFGLKALIGTLKQAELMHVRNFAQDMLKRYPHLYTIEYQPRISLADRPQFEAAQRQMRGAEFVIRDFGFGQKRTWQPAPARPFYFPIILMEPDLEEAKDVYGLDVYHDPMLGLGIDAALQSGQMQTTAPFNLVEGGRGYLFFLPVKLSPSYPGDPGIGVMSLLIRTNKLLPETLPKHLRFELVHNQYGFQYGPIVDSGWQNPARHLGWLPEFSQEKAIGSAYQPFILHTSWQLGREVLTPLTLSAPPALAALLLLLMRLLLQQIKDRRHAEQAAKLAQVRASEHAHAAELERRLRERETELNHLNRFSAMGEMASGLAHEINQPLAAILSYNEACLMLLTKEEPELDTLRNAMTAAATQAKRAGDIIARLRAFISKKASPYKPVVLQSVLDDVIALVAHELRQLNVNVKKDFPQEALFVSGDAILLSQVFLNMIRNALDAMEDVETPELHLRGGAIYGRIRLYVIDNGSGLSSEVKDRLFHPFFTTKTQGMGLGLSISQSIIEQHGGSLSADNVSGGGTAFCVDLPMTVTEEKEKYANDLSD